MRDNYVALLEVIAFPVFSPYFDLLQVSFLMYNVMSSEVSFKIWGASPKNWFSQINMSLNEIIYKEMWTYPDFVDTLKSLT